MIATIQAIDHRRFDVVGPPWVRSRTASTTIVTGWCFAKARSGPGMRSTLTNADDANTSGARIGNDAACAVSPFGRVHADDREHPRQRVGEPDDERKPGE